MDTSNEIVWLKTLSPEDLNFTRLIRNTYSSFFHNHEEISEEKHKSWFEIVIQNNPPTFHIIMLGKIPIGTISVAQYTNDTFTIGNVLIDGAFRGKGYGTRAMYIAMGLAVSRGADKISLSVEYDNEKANYFYEKLGFKCKAVIMERTCL